MSRSYGPLRLTERCEVRFHKSLLPGALLLALTGSGCTTVPWTPRIEPPFPSDLLQRIPEYERAREDTPMVVLETHARNMELAGACRAQLHALITEIEVREETYR